METNYKNLILINQKKIYDIICDQSYVELLLLLILVNDKEQKRYGIKKTYYAGATLCIDMSNDVIIMCNLDETFTVIWKDFKYKRLLSLKGVIHLFTIYQDNKGINQHFVKKYEQSCIRHILN